MAVDGTSTVTTNPLSGVKLGLASSATSMFVDIDADKPGYVGSLNTTLWLGGGVDGSFVVTPNMNSYVHETNTLTESLTDNIVANHSGIYFTLNGFGYHGSGSNDGDTGSLIPKIEPFTLSTAGFLVTAMEKFNFVSSSWDTGVTPVLTGSLHGWSFAVNSGFAYQGGGIIDGDAIDPPGVQSTAWGDSTVVLNKNIDRYNEAGNSWTEVSTALGLNDGFDTEFATAFTLENLYGYVFGGRVVDPIGGGLENFIGVGSFLKFDIITDTVIAQASPYLPDDDAGRFGGTGAVLRDIYGFAVGGFWNFVLGTVGLMERYDSSSGTWSFRTVGGFSLITSGLSHGTVGIGESYIIFNSLADIFEWNDETQILTVTSILTANPGAQGHSFYS